MKKGTPPSAVTKLPRAAGFLFLALLPLVTLVPYDPVPVWLTQDLVVRLASCFAFLVCLAGFFRRSPLPASLPLGFPALLLLALTAWVLLSTLSSPQSFDSFYAFRGYLAIALWWFALSALWEREEGLYPAFEKILFWTAGLSAAWLSLSTLGHALKIEFFVREVVPRQGFFTNPNVAAGFLGLVLVLFSLKALHGEKVSRWGLGLIFLGWCLTQSRGGLLAMVVVVVLFLVLHMGEVEAKLRSWSRTRWVLAGGVFLVMLVPLSFMVERLFGAFEADPRSHFRIDVWISSLKMALAKPIFGFGPGTFQDVYPAFRPGSIWNTKTAFAHNEYLQVAAECGWPALGLLLLLLAALLGAFLAAARKAPAFGKVPLAVRVQEAAFLMLLLEATHNFVDFTFHEWSHRLLLLAVVTFALRGKREGGPLRAVLEPAKPVLVAAGLGLALVLAWWQGVGAIVDHLARIQDFRGKILLAKGDWEGAEALARKCRALRPNFMEPLNTLGALEDARATAAEDRRDRNAHFRKAREYFRKAIELAPYSLTPRENEIQDLMNRGSLREALDLQEELIERVPELPTYYGTLGAIHLRMGRPAEALKAGGRMIELDAYFLPGYLLKARALERLGRGREALRTYQDAQKMLGAAGWKDPSGQVKAGIERLQGP